MTLHDIAAKGPHPREVREERARAFWQAQINEGAAAIDAQQAARNRLTAPRQDAAASSPRPSHVPLRVVSTDPEFAEATPPITAVDIPALFLAASSVLRLINAGTSDGRRYSAAPQAKDRAAWRLVQSAVPGLTDKAAQEVIDSWLRAKVLETRSSRDPLNRRHHPGLFVTPLNEPAEVF